MEETVTRQQAEGVRWLSRGLWALALAGLAYLAGLTAWLGVTGLLFPYQLDYGEGVHLHFVKQWFQGRPVYKAIEGYPYITFNYAPLHILLALALTPLLGFTYATGRVWALVGTVAASVLIALWVRRETGRGLPALAAALLFFGSPYIYHWAPLFRVDLVGLALTLTGLYCVLVAVGPRVAGDPGTGARSRWLWLAVVLFVAGLYAKQSFVFAPAAALLYLFFFVDRRQAVVMALAMGLLGGGLFVLVNALTGGGFWEALVVSNVNPFLWPEFWAQQADFFGTFAILAVLTLWYLVDKFLLDRRGSVRDRVSLLDLYLLAALGSLGLAGKAGAWENYFFEALAALALCGGLGLARLDDRLRFGRLLAPALVLVQVALMWHTPRVADRYLQLTQQSNEAMVPILARTPDPMISEDMGLLVTNDKTLDYHSFQYSQLARAGRWDQAWELGQLRQRNLSIVILEEGTRLDVDHYQRFTREFLSELDRNYRHARTVGKYELYEPDPLQHEERAEFGDQLALVGWSLTPTPAGSTQGGPEPFLQAGQPISLTVVWQAQQALSTDYTAFAHLVDEQGQGWAGEDHQPYDGLYPTSAWGAGEMVRDLFRLRVPADAPPGLYHVQVGWYDPATLERLPVGEGDVFQVATLPVGEPATGTGTEPGAPRLKPVQARFGEAIVLEGYAWQVDPGQVAVTLRWVTEAFLDTDYQVFVHLVDPEEGDWLLAQGDGPPLGGRWPTTHWLPGVALDDDHAIELPVDLEPGSYHLLVGLYDPDSQERVRLPDGGDFVRLVGLEIR